jgi:hypothetical protein
MAGYGLDDHSLIRGWNTSFSLQHQAQINSQVHSVPYLTGTDVCCILGCKLSEREADHSDLSSAEVNCKWRFTSISPTQLYCVMLDID